MKIWVRQGVTRIVIVTERLAIKVPNMRHGMWGFCQGVLANKSERDWSGWPGVNPQLYSILGIVAFYRRAMPVTPGVDVPLDPPAHDDPWWREISLGMVGVDPKYSNLGIVHGILVWIDYASQWNHRSHRRIDVS